MDGREAAERQRSERDARTGCRRPTDGGGRSVTARFTHRPDGSTWGDWGPDDELGRINLLTPDKVRAGVREVHEGISFCLSLPLDLPGGTALNQRRHPPRIAPTEDMAGVPD